MAVSSERRRIVRLDDSGGREAVDQVAVEAPLTIVVDGEVLATTMRTPGHDLELAAGWLASEARVRRSTDIVSMGAFATRDADSVDTVRVHLAPGIEPPRARAFVTSAACGVCSADIVRATPAPEGPLQSSAWRLVAAHVPAMLEAMAAGQAVFGRSGSVHAACLLEPDLSTRAVREDVGRHNAVDKVVGDALMADLLPLTDHVLVVSGRVSFEIVHKALAAGVAAIVAVSGPSTLAVDLAREHGLVLVGFARDGRLNVYAGDNRVTMAE